MIRRVARALSRRASRLASAARVCAPALANAIARAPRDGGCRVSYGHRRIPPPESIAHGGMVKLQALHETFPHHDRFNVAYLVSSALPDAAPVFARWARAGGARLVVNQNGVASPAWPGAGWQAVNRPLAELQRLADHVLYQSEFCREAATRFLGERRGPGEVLYNAVDTESFTPATHDPDPARLTLLLGGNQDQRYRLTAALQTVAGLVRGGEPVRLLVTGGLRWGGEAALEARSLVARLGLSEHVEFLGPYTRRDAPSIVRRAHLLLHTKYNDPCPGVVIEAMACGLPVVYSSSGGVPELVGDAGVGVAAAHSFEQELAPDPEALADAVLRAARERVRLSALARERAVGRFDIRPWLERHRRLFAELLAG